MLIGIAAAMLACFGYGTASVLQGYGARQSSTEVGVAADHGPSLKSTVAAALTPAFIAGMVLDLVGFAGSLVSARLIPLFLSQTIMSANLAVTAVLGIAVLGVRDQRRVRQICVWMKRSWLHLLTVYVEIVLNSGKAVSEFRERRPDFSANRTCDAIAAVMGRVGV
ncbi:Putative integral membrane protein [Mycobacteroides abscessus subsp. abscessus]|nr:Putative integral membrane protein [Mycobacteroides abscessus subsp. abscessus]